MSHNRKAPVVLLSGIVMWDEIPEDVKAELLNPKFSSRSHYSRSTYADGCHGPLCQKAERDRSRRRTEYRAARSGRKYTPAPRTPEDLATDALLDRIIDWVRNQPKPLSEAVA